MQMCALATASAAERATSEAFIASAKVTDTRVTINRVCLPSLHSERSVYRKANLVGNASVWKQENAHITTTTT